MINYINYLKRSLRAFVYLLLMFFLILSNNFTLSAQITAQHYHIYSVKQQLEVSLGDIVDDMAQYDVVFYGEQHNDSVTHFLEFELLKRAHEKYGNHLALSMEMFDRDVQVVMNEYLDGAIREKNLKKDARVWSNYNDYRPMVEYAKENKLDIICANAAGRYSNMAGRKGMEGLEELESSSKLNIAPLPFDTAIGKYHDKIVALTNHNSSPPKTDSSKPAPVSATPPMSSMGNFNFVMGQSLWDATMAYSIASYLKKYPNMKILQFNGRVHSDEGFGAVTQLNHYKRKVKSLIISTFSDENFGKTNWDDFKHLGDYIIITDPSVPTTYE